MHAWSKLVVRRPTHHRTALYHLDELGPAGVVFMVCHVSFQMHSLAELQLKLLKERDGERNRVRGRERALTLLPSRGSTSRKMFFCKCYFADVLLHFLTCFVWDLDGMNLHQPEEMLLLVVLVVISWFSSFWSPSKLTH